MGRWSTPMPDLFAPRRPVPKLPPEQRAAAVKRLETLLKEASATPVPEGGAIAGQEVGDDQDHR